MSAELSLAKIIPPDVPQRYLEVGVLRAENLVALAEDFPLMSLVGVDSYEAYTDQAHGNYHVVDAASKYNKIVAERNIKKCGHGDRIKLWVIDSSVAAKQTPDAFYDVVFLDKNFTEEETAQDVMDWYSKVVPGGILCGHDAYTHVILQGVEEALRRCGVPAPPNIINNEVWWIKTK
jgi:hypothetical protein